MIPHAHRPPMAAAPQFAGAIAERARQTPLPTPGFARAAVDNDNGFAPGDRSFIALCQAYRASGGIARGEDVAHWLVGRGEGGSRQLAAKLVAGELFSFDWRGTFWLPMFQLQPEPQWRQACGQVLAELRPALDGWQLAAWFVQPNSWLRDARPLDLLADQHDRVLAAARADRYVAHG